MFRVYYSNREADWQGEIPEDIVQRDRVICIAYDDDTRGYGDVGRIVIREFNYYLYSDHTREWHGTNAKSDVIEHCMLYGCGPGGVRVILKGIQMNWAEYQEIIRLAETDPGLRAKNARRPEVEDGRD